MTMVARVPAPPVPRLARADVGAAVAAAVVLAVLGVFLLWPLASVLVAGVTAAQGVGLEAYAVVVQSPRLVRVVIDTLLVAVVSTIVTMALGLVLAYAATRTTMPGRRLVALLGVLPAVSPPFLAALALVLLFGRDGMVSRGLGVDWSIEGLHGIVLAQVLTFVPYAFLLLAGALAAIDADLEDVAESLGAGALTTLRRVTLVLARPRLASAALVVFVLCAGDFGTPMLVGGDRRVLTTEIHAQMAAGGSGLTVAAALGVLLLVPCALAIILDTWRLGSRSYAVSARPHRVTARGTPAGIRGPLLVVAAGVTLAIGVVHAVILLGALVRPAAGGWTLSPVHDAFAASEGARAMWTSLGVAMLSGLAGTVLALLIAHLVVRRRRGGAAAVEALALLPVAVPGAVLGVGYLLAFADPPAIGRGTLWMIVASVAVWKLPIAVPAAVTALRRIDPALEEAAVSLGAGTARTLVRIALPLVGRAALGVFIDLFVGALFTVGAVVFLAGPGFPLVSLTILGQAAGGNAGAACALAAVVVVVGAGALLLRRAVGAEDRVAILMG